MTFPHLPEEAEIECLIVIPIELISESGDHIVTFYYANILHRLVLLECPCTYVITFYFTAVRMSLFIVVRNFSGRRKNIHHRHANTHFATHGKRKLRRGTTVIDKL